AWKAVALPLSYTRTRRTANRRQRAEVFVRFYRPNGGGGRTRTYEGVSQRIKGFSLPLILLRNFPACRVYVAWTGPPLPFKSLTPPADCAPHANSARAAAASSARSSPRGNRWP